MTVGTDSSRRASCSFKSLNNEIDTRPGLPLRHMHHTFSLFHRPSPIERAALSYGRNRRAHDRHTPSPPPARLGKALPHEPATATPVPTQDSGASLTSLSGGSRWRLANMRAAPLMRFEMESPGVNCRAQIATSSLAPLSCVAIGTAIATHAAHAATKGHRTAWHHLAQNCREEDPSWRYARED